MGHGGEPIIHHEGVDLVGPARYDKCAALHPGAVHERRLGAGARQVTAVTFTRIPSTCRRASGSAKRPRAPEAGVVGEHGSGGLLLLKRR